MNTKRLNNLVKDETSKRILNFIPNELGINLCSVKDVIVNRQKDGQIMDIKIEFIPSSEEEKELKELVKKEIENESATFIVA